MTIDEIRAAEKELLRLHGLAGVPQTTVGRCISELLALYDVQAKELAEAKVKAAAPTKVWVVVTCPPGTPPLVHYQKLVPGSILHSVHLTMEGANSVQHVDDYRFELEVLP